jgi:RNA polymerase sigma-70 factor, ECF subfamily
MVELEEMSQKEYAEKINLSYSAAKSRVQQARQLLNETLIACCNYQFDKYENIIGCCKNGIATNKFVLCHFYNDYSLVNF